MTEWIAALQDLGRFSATYLLIPAAIWTIAAAPLFVLSRFLGRRRAILHYHACLALLISLPLGFLVMPFASTSLPPLLPEFSTQTIDAPVFPATPPPASTPPQAPVPSSPASDHRVEPSFSLDAYFFAGLLALASALAGLFRMGSFAYHAKKLRDMRVHLPEIRDEETLSLLSTLKDRLEITDPVILLAGRTGMPPMTFGWLQPAIVMPESLLQDPAHLRTTLLHELIHVRRRDYLLGLVQEIVTAVFTFHPGVHMLRRDIRLYREISCDADTIRAASVSPNSYARMLLHFTEAPGYAEIAMVRSASTLKKRIKAMSNHLPMQNAYAWHTRIALLGFFILAPALLVACSSEERTSGDYAERVVELEAQVAYLRAEIDHAYDAIKENAAKTSSDDPEFRRMHSSTEKRFQNDRILLLNEMLIEHMRALEVARMEASTAEWVLKVNAGR